MRISQLWSFLLVHNLVPNLSFSPENPHDFNPFNRHNLHKYASNQSNWECFELLKFISFQPFCFEDCKTSFASPNFGSKWKDGFRVYWAFWSSDPISTNKILQIVKSWTVLESWDNKLSDDTQIFCTKSQLYLDLWHYSIETPFSAVSRNKV